MHSTTSPDVQPWSLAEVAAVLQVHADDICRAPDDLLPHSEAELSAFVHALLMWRRTLEEGQPVVWVQSLQETPTLELDEAEQLLGLIADVRLVQKSIDGANSQVILAAGVVRERAVCLAWRWGSGLLSDRRRSRACLRRLLRCHAEARAGFHFIEVSGIDSEVHWRSGVERLLAFLALQAPAAALGIHYSSPPTSVDQHDHAVETVRKLATAVGFRHQPAALSVTGSEIIRVSSSLAAQLARHRLQMDCSLPTLERSDETACAYIREPYLALPFDLRVPRAVNDDGGQLLECPHVSPLVIRDPRPTWWARLTHSPERVITSALDLAFDGRERELATRLETTLSRSRRSSYLAALENDRSLVEQWHQYHVYNWAPPPKIALMLFQYDARDLERPDFLLKGLQGGSDDHRVRTASAMLQTAKRVASEQLPESSSALLKTQVRAHEYLSTGGRDELTADSEQLIAELPDRLGDTLELGFGYGLTARRIRSRARRYVGIDLLVDQARALALQGGQGVVADIHALPLSSASFDSVIADNVLEHAFDPVQALREMKRVLRPNGRAYVLIPLDAKSSDYQIRTHLWKADEWSLREATIQAGLCVQLQRVMRYSELSVYGCFPASAGQTCLMVLQGTGCEGSRSA